MLKRIITGVLLLGYVVAMLYFGASNYIFIDALILSFTLIGIFEITKCVKKAGYKPYIFPILLSALSAYPLWHFFGVYALLAAYVVPIIISLSIFTLKADKPVTIPHSSAPTAAGNPDGFKNFGVTVLSILYPGFLMALAFIMTKQYSALFIVIFAVFVPISSDAGAYFIGSFFGKHKLCPSISPKKTVEGAVGGLLGAVIMSVAIYLVMEYFALFEGIIDYVPMTESVGASLAIYIGMGLVGGVLSQIGDLAASRIKRVLGVKDFGNIFPGHGGALDRIDSIMFMLALMFVVLQFVY